MIRQAIVEKIAAIPEVATICEGRVFWLRNENADDSPCIVFELAGGAYSSMTSCGPSGPHEAAMAFYAVSEDPEEAVTLDAAVVAALHGQTWTAGGTTVQLCRFTDRLQDMFDAESREYFAGSAATLTYADN